MKKNLRSKKEKQEYQFLHCILILFFYIYTQCDRQAKKTFNLSWMRVLMPYHRFNNLAELLNGDLITKIGRGILSIYLMNR